MKSFLLSLGFFICTVVLIPVTSWSQGQPQNELNESSELESDKYLNGLVKKNLIPDQRIMPMQPIEEGDIAWEKRIQRVVETREKLNLFFRSQELNLFSSLRNMINEGKIKAFSDENFSNPLSASEIEAKMVTFDTTFTFDPDTYENKAVIAKNEINWEDIYQYRLTEIHYFDKQRSVKDVRLLGIAPIYQSPKNKDAGIPPAPIFWIYYPETREPMSHERIFIDDNDNAPSTWASVFDQRRYTSYIYKRSNVLDYRLKDFFVPNPEDPTDNSPVDMLMYSEKIKNELLNFEHDLWEY
jgi:gliding motility associated protien GldN